MRSFQRQFQAIQMGRSEKVQDYAKRLEKLASALPIYPTNTELINRFEFGLTDELQQFVGFAPRDDYNELVMAMEQYQKKQNQGRKKFPQYGREALNEIEETHTPKAGGEKEKNHRRGLDPCRHIKHG